MQAEKSKTVEKAGRAEAKRAAALLRRAAWPDIRHLKWATFWLIIAAALEVVGPVGSLRLLQHRIAC